MDSLRALRAYQVLIEAVLASPSPAAAVDSLVEAIGAASEGSATFLRRASDGTYGAVGSLAERPLPGGRAALSGTPFRLENAPPDEAAVPVPGSDPPELVLSARFGEETPAAFDRAVLELIAASFALALRNAALHGEGQRRRADVLDVRSTQAELVARLAHDVRGPVTTIVGFARLFEEDGRFPPDAREALAVIRASGERIGELASDVALLSRIELAAVEPQWRTVDLAALLEGAGAVVEGAGPRLIGDPDLLAAALGRLVEEGSRPPAPVRALIDDLGEAVALELRGTGASPAGDAAAPSLGGRLAERVASRHGGTFRAGAADGEWWVRLTLPIDPTAGAGGLE